MNTMMQSYVSIDLETTGLDPKTDKITEIGAVKVKNGVIKDTFETLVNPGRKLEPRVAELTGLREEDLSKAPYIAEVLPGLLDFLEDLPLLGHSVLFDFSFLKKACVNEKLELDKQAVDTLKIARKYLADLEHRNLDFLCVHYGIPHQAHRALEDARATDLLYRRLTEQFYQSDDDLFCPKTLIYRAKRDTPATKAQKERLYRLISQHKIIQDVDIERLTRSEASRMTDKILTKYGRASEHGGVRDGNPDTPPQGDAG